MIFGFDRYVDVHNYHAPVPLPNARVQAESLEPDYNVLSMYNPYNFLFKKHLEFSDHGFGHAPVDSLLESNENFIYAILIKDKTDIHKLADRRVFDFPTKVIEAVKRGQSKIMLCYIMEGDFYGDGDIEAINNFVVGYDLKERDVIFLNGNLKLWNHPKAKFTLRPFNYFLMNPWFMKHDLLDESKEDFLKYLADDRIDYISNFEKPKKFLSFNRRPRPHRIALFAELSKEVDILNNSIISLGGVSLDTNQFGRPTKDSEFFLRTYKDYISDNYKHNKQSGLDFYRNYKAAEDTTADANLNYNLAFNLNESAHLNTFVNVMTETLFEPETIFLSEKIWKPIYCCQPFIVFGNPGTLNALRGLGFKTFHKFWDESYDVETDFTKRLEKIIDIVKELNTKSNAELFDITKQMVPLLQHNFENYLKVSRDEFFKLKQALHEQFS